MSIDKNRMRKFLLIFNSGGYNGVLDESYYNLLVAVEDAGGALPSLEQQHMHNSMVTAMKADGDWDKSEFMYVFRNDAGLIFSSFNWIDPDKFRLPFGTGISWESNVGIVTDGGVTTTTGVINTGWNPSIHSKSLATNQEVMYATGKYWVSSGDTLLGGGTDYEHNTNTYKFAVSNTFGTGLYHTFNRLNSGYFVGSDRTMGWGLNSIISDPVSRFTVHNSSVGSNSSGDRGFSTVPYYLFGYNRNNSVNRSVRSGTCLSFYRIGAISDDKLRAHINIQNYLDETGLKVDTIRDVSSFRHSSGFSKVDSEYSVDWSDNGNVTKLINLNDKVNGAGSVEVISNSASDSYIEHTFPVVLGSFYEVALSHKAGIGSNQLIEFIGLDETDIIPTTSWSDYNSHLLATLTGNATIRIYTNKNGGSIGDSIFVDKFAVWNVQDEYMASYAENFLDGATHNLTSISGPPLFTVETVGAYLSANYTRITGQIGLTATGRNALQSLAAFSGRNNWSYVFDARQGGGFNRNISWTEPTGMGQVNPTNDVWTTYKISKNGVAAPTFDARYNLAASGIVGPEVPIMDIDRIRLYINRARIT